MNMPIQLQLAAIISLLSSSALRGTTAGKNFALCMHLDGLLRHQQGLDPDLQKILEEVLAEWKVALHLSCPVHYFHSHPADPMRH